MVLVGCALDLAQSCITSVRPVLLRVFMSLFMRGGLCCEQTHSGALWSNRMICAGVLRVGAMPGPRPVNCRQASTMELHVHRLLVPV